MLILSKKACASKLITKINITLITLLVIRVFVDKNTIEPILIDKNVVIVE